MDKGYVAPAIVSQRVVDPGNEERIRGLEAVVRDQLPPRSRIIGACSTLIHVKGQRVNRTFRRARVSLEFSDEAIAAAGGEVARYRYWRAGEDMGDAEVIVSRVADCLIPNSPQAVDEVWAHFAKRGPVTGLASALEGQGGGLPSAFGRFVSMAATAIGPRELMAAVRSCGDYDDACDIDGIDMTICQDPTEWYDPWTGNCEGGQGGGSDPEPDPDPSGCDPAFENCGAGGGSPPSGGGPDDGCNVGDLGCESDFVLDFQYDDGTDGLPGQETINCNNPAHRQARSIDAFCLGTPVKQTSSWSKVDATIDRIAQRGGVCSSLAAKARSLADSGRLRLYDGRHGPGWGSDNDDFAVLDQGIFGTYYDMTTFRDARIPDYALAHEVEHAMGFGHVSVYGLEARYNTPNSVLCGGGVN